MSGEKMRVSSSSSTKQLCRGKPSDVSTKWKGSTTTSPPVHGHINLPSNTGNLIPNAYYQQFKGWYEVSHVPETDRAEEQKKFLSSFKWRHTVNTKTKCPWTAPSRPREDQRRNSNDCRLHRIIAQDKQNRSLSPEPYSNDSGPCHRHSSRCGHKHRIRSRSQNHS